MSMAIVEQKPVTPLRCHRCKHEWLYGGKNPYYAMCPFCRTQLSIKKHRIEEDKKMKSEQVPQSGIDSRQGQTAGTAPLQPEGDNG